MADLSVIIVNYNSAWFCANLVDSLQDQAFKAPDGRPGSLEIIVVDNASPQDQHAQLDPLKERGIKVIYSQENSGYSGGNNLGMEQVTSDWVMICNPDVVLMPGSLQQMLEALYQDPQVGLVGPQGWLDPAFHFHLPPVERLSPWGHLYEAGGRIFQFLGKSYSLRRTRYALRHWIDGEPVEADTISGFCFLMPTPLAREFGPLDPKFPFYYEDDDLSMRLQKAGYKRLYMKGTRVIHFYNKSAGPVFHEVLEKYFVSKRYFMEKHYGPLSRFLYRISTEYLKKNMDRLKGYRYENPVDLGDQCEPPSLPLAEGRTSLVEITLDPAFVLAAGHLHEGGVYRMPDLTWSAMDANQWYLRVLDGSGKRILKSYTFKKTVHPVLPPTYAELKGMQL